MGEYRAIVVGLLLRLIPSALLFGVSWVLLAGAEGGIEQAGRLMIGMGFMIAGALTLALPLASLFAEPAHKVYYSDERFEKPPPVYGIPEARRKSGLHAEALALYEQILRDHPGELKAYVAMMDIAVVDLQDAALARTFFRRGLEGLAREEDRLALTAMYEAISSRLRGG